MFVDGRGHAMAGHATSERRGKRMELDGGIVFRIVGDKATDLDEFVDDIDKFNDYWS